MPDIVHAIQIAVPAKKLFPLVSTGPGLAVWWAEDMRERPDGTVDPGFFNRATIYSVQPVRVASPTDMEWLCTSGTEWQGTKIVFRLAENKGQTQLRFTHASWQAATDHFISCNTTWGGLMFRLKAVAEGAAPQALFARNGWSL
jgi:uncharacterized protein YndB with AHSA1/START domain